MEYREDKAYGITERSTKFLKDNLQHIGEVQRIAGFIEKGEQWTSFENARGDKITVSGFSWGYAGAGPHGLLKAMGDNGFNIDIEFIAGLKPAHGWAIVKVPKTFDEEFCNTSEML